MLGAMIGDMVGSTFGYEDTLCAAWASSDLFLLGSSVTERSLLMAASLDALSNNRALHDSFVDIYQNKTSIIVSNKTADWIDGRAQRLHLSGVKFAAIMPAIARYSPSIEDAKSNLRLMARWVDVDWFSVCAASAMLETLNFFKVNANRPADSLIAEATRSLIENYGLELGQGIDDVIAGVGYCVDPKSRIAPGIIAAFNGGSFEGAIRLAIAYGGDCSSTAAIAGGIAEAIYGIPLYLEKRALDILVQNPDMIGVVRRWHVESEFDRPRGVRSTFGRQNAKVARTSSLISLVKALLLNRSGAASSAEVF